MHICALPVFREQWQSSVHLPVFVKEFYFFSILLVLLPKKKERKGLVLLFVVQTLAVLREMKNKHIFI